MVDGGGRRKRSVRADSGDGFGKLADRSLFWKRHVKESPPPRVVMCRVKAADNTACLLHSHPAQIQCSLNDDDAIQALNQSHTAFFSRLLCKASCCWSVSHKTGRRYHVPRRWLERYPLEGFRLERRISAISRRAGKTFYRSLHRQ